MQISIFIRLLSVVILFMGVTMNSVLAGPNANATLSLDLIADGGLGNQRDDGVTSDVVIGAGTKIAVEVFATGVTTSLKTVYIQFALDKSILQYSGTYGDFPSGNAAFDTMRVHENNNYPNFRYVFLFRGNSSGIIGDDGFLARVEFITIKDVTNVEFKLTLMRVLLAHGELDDYAYDNIVPVDPVSIEFNSSNPSTDQNILGPNVNVTASLDLINHTDIVVAGIEENQNNGILSDVHQGVGQLFLVRVFLTGVITPLTSIRIVFDYSADLVHLRAVYHRNLFPNYDLEYTGATLITNNPVVLPSSGYLLSAEFATANEQDIQIGVRKLTITSDLGQYNDIAVTDVISLTLASSIPLPPPPFDPPLPPSPVVITPPVTKNILPGDLNGDGSVGVADLQILADNFGQAGGDIFDPTRLYEGRETTAITRTMTRPQITLLPGSWGSLSGSVAEAAFNRVRDVFSNRLVYPTDSNINVEPVDPFNGPSVAYARQQDGSYYVKIARSADVGGLTFQFAHEYGHILSNYRESNFSVVNQHKWFDESIASLASLFAYRMIPELNDTFHAFIKNIRVTENGFGGFAPSRSNPRTLTRWYQHHKTVLEMDARDFDKNKVVALMLFDLFEDYPNDAWNAIRYMNRGPIRYADSFETYLNGWYRCTPPQWQFIVEHIMYRFGVPHVNGAFLTVPGNGIK